MCEPTTQIYERADSYLRSYGIDAFYASPLEQVLNDAHLNLIGLCGRWFETTVHSTMREANDRGLECLAIEDLCCCIDPSIRHNTISQIEMSGGIFGAVASSSELLALINR